MFLTANGWTWTQPILADIKKLFCKLALKKKKKNSFFSCITLTKNLSAVLRACPHKWWVRHFIIFPFNSQTLCHTANSVTRFSKASFSTTVTYMTAATGATGYINTLSSKCFEIRKKKGVEFGFTLSTSISFRIRQLWA